MTLLFSNISKEKGKQSNGRSWWSICHSLWGGGRGGDFKFWPLYILILPLDRVSQHIEILNYFAIHFRYKLRSSILQFCKNFGYDQHKTIYRRPFNHLSHILFVIILIVSEYLQRVLHSFQLFFLLFALMLPVAIYRRLLVVILYLVTGRSATENNRIS